MKTLVLSESISYSSLNFYLGTKGYKIDGVIRLTLKHYESKKGNIGGYMALPESYGLIKKNFGETTRLKVFSCTGLNNQINKLVRKIEIEEGNPQLVKKHLETAGLETVLQ